MNIYLRPITELDYPLTMAWRSDPDIYNGPYTQRNPLTWEEHLAWNNSRNDSWKVFIAVFNERSIGTLNITQLDYWCPETGIYIGEKTLWGRGIGKKVLELALTYIKERGYKHTMTTIPDSNERAKRLYLSFGYERFAVARADEGWYRREL